MSRKGRDEREMTPQMDFNEEEWELITLAPLKVALLAAMTDGGLISYTKEATAYPDALTRAYQKYQDNELIMLVLDDEEKCEKERELQAQREKVSPRDGSFADKLREDLGKAAAIVASKSSPQIALEYRQMLHNLALDIVNASGEGFLGFGKKMSDREKNLLEDLKKVLILD